jgi:hypothetical protein
MTRYVGNNPVQMIDPGGKEGAPVTDPSGAVNQKTAAGWWWIAPDRQTAWLTVPSGEKYLFRWNAKFSTWIPDSNTTRLENQVIKQLASQAKPLDANEPDFESALDRADIGTLSATLDDLNKRKEWADKNSHKHDSDWLWQKITIVQTAIQTHKGLYDPQQDPSVWRGAAIYEVAQEATRRKALRLLQYNAEWTSQLGLKQPPPPASTEELARLVIPPKSWGDWLLGPSGFVWEGLNATAPFAGVNPLDPSGKGLGESTPEPQGIFKQQFARGAPIRPTVIPEPVPQPGLLPAPAEPSASEPPFARVPQPVSGEAAETGRPVARTPSGAIPLGPTVSVPPNASTATEGPAYQNVAMTGPQGKLGEFDQVLPDQFVEDKSATDIPKGLKFTGKTYEQAAEDWALNNIYNKTATRIQNISKATEIIPEEGIPASATPRPMPKLSQIQGIRKFEFRIDETNAALKIAVERQVKRLQADFPKYEFIVKYPGEAKPGG